jgi:hypothetical protein
MLIIRALGGFINMAGIETRSGEYFGLGVQEASCDRILPR